MSDHTDTMKVLPWGSDQGEFVVINKADFDPKVHEPFEPAEDAGSDKPLDQLTAAELKALATERGLTFPGNASKASLIELLSA